MAPDRPTTIAEYIRAAPPEGQPHLRRLYVASALLALAGGCSGALSDDAMVVEIPSTFSEHRIYVRPVTAAGDTLLFYTDTGGGTNMLYEPTAERLDVPRERIASGGDSLLVTAWPAWKPDRSIPQPVDTTGPLGGRLLITPLSGQAAVIHDSATAGFLGRLWFADRVWTIDYPGQRLLLRPDGTLPPHDPAQRVPLGFLVDSASERLTHFPRIRVQVEGDTLDLLFDTGATMALTDSAVAVLADGRPARRAASFISAAVFDRWRDEHPDWRVIERATAFEADLIEVPRVTIAGVRVGPVWFERRGVGIFEEYMSRWMDRPIVGALGGNALRFFRVTVDYPDAVAVFERTGP